MARDMALPFYLADVLPEYAVETVKGHPRAYIRSIMIASSVLSIVLCMCSLVFGVLTWIVFFPFGVSIIWSIVDLFYAETFKGATMHPVVLFIGDFVTFGGTLTWMVFCFIAASDHYYYRGSQIMTVYSTIPQLCLNLLFNFLQHISPLFQPTQYIHVVCPSCQQRSKTTVHLPLPSHHPIFVPINQAGVQTTTSTTYNSGEHQALLTTDPFTNGGVAVARSYDPVIEEGGYQSTPESSTTSTISGRNSVQKA